MEKKMPDGIIEARDGMNEWSGTVDPEKEAKWVDYAMAWAAIAQAEELRRANDLKEAEMATFKEIATGNAATLQKLVDHIVSQIH